LGFFIGLNNPQVTFEVYSQTAFNHMKSFLSFIAFFALLVSSQSSYCQLVVNSNLTIEQYIQDVLLGQNVTVSNITYNGASANTVAAPVGEFECEDCNLGMPGGFIMSSGNATSAAGPNNTSGATDIIGTTVATDPDLAAISGVAVVDQCVIEFDFVPLGDTLRFNYIFASEEYPEFSNGGVNDSFGFFLSGPGINGPYSNNAENIALIPGTTTPVSINTINNGFDGISGPCNNCEYYNQDGTGNPDDDSFDDPYYMQFDGYTDLFTAYAIVQCGLTYHIKLAICDGGDGVLNSAVFLERESFASNLVVQVAIQFEAGGPDGNTLFEDCGSSNIVFSRPETGDVNTPLTAYIEYGGAAQELIDYSDLPDSVLFAPGVESVSFPFTAILDFTAEGIENIVLTIANFAECGETLMESEFEFFINDTADPLVVEGYTTSICDGATIEIEPIISGGYGVYEFDWSSGEDTETITVSPLATTTYSLIVSDTCGMPPANADYVVEVAEFPPFSVTIDQGDFIV
jgi:hypothetical protein